ncbi:MAG: hypothetical protein JWR28_1371 [Modestobacter sp.]|nr:hypothetical protein [Modestobacter sp.]
MTADMWQFSGGIAGAEGRPVDVMVTVTVQDPVEATTVLG